VARPLSRADYLFLQEFLLARIGHDLGEGKEYLVESRLGTLARDLGFDGLAPIFDRLRAGREPAIAVSVCEAMVTGETSFFRNASAFERLRESVFPRLLAARADERRLRIWSAGCSTGQEPYSLALTLLDHFPETRRWDVRILATDVSEPALRQAEVGSFSAQDVRRGLDDRHLRAYFTPHEGRWLVGTEARRMVKFEPHNLLDPRPFPGTFDLILVRNVLIYFATSARARVFSLIRRSIRDDGFLFLGESETILGQGDDFTFAEAGLDYYRPALDPANKSGYVS